jgi:hypothetical protein
MTKIKMPIRNSTNHRFRARFIGVEVKPRMNANSFHRQSSPWLLIRVHSRSFAVSSAPKIKMPIRNSTNHRFRARFIGVEVKPRMNANKR